MSVQIKLTTAYNSTIKIEFLENEFIDEFIPHMKRNMELFELDSWRDKIPNSPREWNDSYIKENEKKIIYAINNLNTMGLDFPILPEEIKFEQNSSYGRQLLNRLHRHFTTSHRSVSWEEPIQLWEDNTNNIFCVTEETYEEFSKYVHIINDIVHDTETFYYTNDRTNNFPIYYEYQIVFNSNKPLDKNNDNQNGYFQNIKDEHYRYFTDELKYDVWLPLHQIQGKNYWIAYFDEDDPRSWDVCTNIFYSGSFAIGDRTAAKNPDLEKWLMSYDITPGPLTCGMPLGYVIEGKEIVETLGFNDIIKLEFL
jgi:hypothetical protein